MTKNILQFQKLFIETEQSPQGISKISILPASARNKAKKNAALSRQLDQSLRAPIDAKTLDMSWATDFQRQVYKAMMKIKPGQVLTYKQLAEKIGKPKAFRAVAQACARNKLPILIPCHRVVRSDGGLGGYSGTGGLTTKKYLLNLEGYKTA